VQFRTVKGEGVVTQHYWTGRTDRRRLLQGAGGLGLAAAIAAACGGDDKGKGQTTSGGSPAASGAGYREAAPVINVTLPPPYSKKYPDVTKLLSDFHWSKSPDRAKPQRPQFGGVFKGVLIYTPLLDWVKTDASAAAGRTAMTHSNVINLDVGAFAKDATRTDVSTRDGLAESWEQVDSLNYVFHFRSGVKWHNIAPVNGRDFTAEDVKYAWTVLGKEGVHTATMSQIDSIEVPDAKTLKMKLKQPYAPFIRLMACPNYSIFAREQWESADGLTKAVIGTGPFIMKKHDPNVEAVYVRNPEFFLKDEEGRQLPYLDAVHDVRTIADANARTAAFLSEQIDYNRMDTPPELLDLRRQKSGAVSQVWPMFAHTGNMFKFNYRNPVLADVRVRRALSLGIDRTNTYIDTVWFGGAVPNDYIPFHELGNAWPDPYDQMGQWYKYDPQQAKQLLAAAGHGSGLKLDAISTTPLRLNVAWMQAAQADLKEIGVDLNVIPTEATASITAYFQSQWKDIHTQGELTRNPTEVEGWVSDNYTSTSPKNFSGYKDARADELSEKQRRELDTQRRVSILKELRDHMRDQVPIVILGNNFQMPTWQGYVHDISNGTVFDISGWGCLQLMRAWMDDKAPKRPVPA
jgi:peptide/nickel transport system substrate-binding protein